MLVPRVSHLETEFTVIIERLIFDRVALTGILRGGGGGSRNYQKESFEVGIRCGPPPTDPPL